GGGRQPHLREALVHAAVAVVVLAVTAGLVANDLIGRGQLHGGAVVAGPAPRRAQRHAAGALAALSAEVADRHQAVVGGVDLAVAVVVDAVAHLHAAGPAARTGVLAA